MKRTNQKYTLIGVQSFNHKVDIGIEEYDYDGKRHYYIMAGNILKESCKSREEAQIIIMEKYANHTDIHDHYED